MLVSGTNGVPPLAQQPREHETRNDQALPEQDTFGAWIMTLVRARCSPGLGRVVDYLISPPTYPNAIQETIVWQTSLSRFFRVRRRRSEPSGEHQARLGASSATGVQRAEGAGRSQPAVVGDEKTQLTGTAEA